MDSILKDLPPLTLARLGALFFLLINVSKKHCQEPSSTCFLYHKIPCGEPHSKMVFKTSKETNLKGKIGKLEIGIKLPECRFKTMQIRTFSKRTYQNTESLSFL